MEAESCKSSCCRRRRMDEDWMTPNKTNMNLGIGLVLPNAVAMFPPSSTQLCHFGATFQGSSHPVVEFQAAIGTTAYSHDVAMFHKISRPCLPCRSVCDQVVCTPSCQADETQGGGGGGGGAPLIEDPALQPGRGDAMRVSCSRTLLDVIIPGATIKPQSQKSVHNMTTSVDDTEPFDYTTIDVPAVKTSRQDGVGVTWDKPHKDENIRRVVLLSMRFCGFPGVSWRMQEI
ncbi:hypothetical protein LSAT2_010027 [Lamellibrachia satsuma]|nr:hypothetical protein LSAT2_010027 [Lamellibrachia satsuma]